MSPLSRSELSIVLCPEQIGLLRTEHKLTLHGYRHDVQSRKIIPCEGRAFGDKPWSRAIETLETALPSIIRRRMAVRVVLSNHFMHYVLVPWLDKLSDEEEMALARHCFKEMYGNAADSLRVRISPGRAGIATLACAVDVNLLDDLSKLIGRLRLDLKSIQPHLMVAYNSCRSSLEGRSAWVALLEPDNLCLAALQKGQVVWIRKMPIGEDWNEELPTLLEREAYLADTGVAMDEVFLWAPHLEEVDIPRGWRGKIRQLTPGRKYR